MQDVLFSIENHIGLVTLNRPSALNALTHEMIIQISKQLTSWEQDSQIHAVIIQAAEGRAFCAGGDIKSLYDLGRKDASAPLNFFKDEYSLNYQIYQYPKPYIALLDGLTFGGGVGVSLHGKYKIATDRFVFSMPETSIGFFPDIGASYILSRLGPYGVFLGLTGQWVNSTLAYRLNLVNYSILHDQLEDLAIGLLNLDLSKNSHQTIELYLQSYSKPKEIGEEESLVNYYFNSFNLLEIIQKLQSSKEEWAQNTLKILNQKSPMSLSVTIEQLRRAKNMNLKACLQMDYRLTYHFMQHPDFYEGVRALMIEKDKKPKWQSIQMNSKQVEDYFSSLPEMFHELQFAELKSD